MQITGKLIEIGEFTLQGRGISIESDGELIYVAGLTEDECKNMGPLLGKSVTVTIAEASI